MTATIPTDLAQILAAGEGDAFWFLGNLVTIKLRGEQTNETLSITEHLAPAGFGPPPHIHHHEDEIILVLEGEVTGFCGDRPFRGGPGTFLSLPRGVPHTWQATGEGPVRLFVVTTPAGFERFCAELGTPAGARTLPPDPVAPAEIERMLAIAPRYGLEFVPAPGEGA